MRRSAQRGIRKAQTGWRAIRVSLGLLLVLFACRHLFAAEDVFGVSNGRLEIAVEHEHGDLVRLTDVHTRQNFAGTASTSAGLWELALFGPEKVLSPADAKSFRCQQISGRKPALRLTWDELGVSAAPALRVEVVVRLEAGQPMSRWELGVTGLGGLGIRQVRFPRIVNIPRQQNERLAVPVWMGQQMAEPRKIFAGEKKAGQREQWAYPGILSMQCLAFYKQDGPGLYVACDDAAGFNKAFAFFGDKEGNVGCEVLHLPERSATGGDRPGVRPSSGAAVSASPPAPGNPEAPVLADVAAPEDGRTPAQVAAVTAAASKARGNGWRLPYAVRLGTFEGDWLTAAERYRAWATNQVWAKESRLARGRVPDWALNTSLWVWNRGRSPDVLGPALVLREKLGLPVSVFWHWWHGCAYDTGFPEYLPPREGAESFTNALASAQAKGIHALVYMNQRLWGMTTQSWRDEAAERFAVKGPDGKVHPEVYNTFTREACASMCMGTEFWRQKYAGLAVRAVTELGVNGIYMDQACTSLACYDPSHGHPVGGGVYWMQGFRAMASDIRHRCDSRREPVVLAGEGCGEPWLPYLDLMLSLQVSRERYSARDGWDTIPFFPAVYHPFAVAYGNYSSLTMPPYDDLWPAESAPKEPLKLLDRKYSRQFCLEQARAFVWGQQPTIANFLPAQLEDCAGELDFVLRLARLRSRAAKYLLHGTFLRPPQLRRTIPTFRPAHLDACAGELDFVLGLARLRSRAAKYLLHGTFLRPPQLRGPIATLDISRLSIYEGRQGGLTAFQKESPLALAGAWRAPDNKIAIAVATIADEPIHVTLDLPDGSYGLPWDSTVYQMDETGRRRIGTLKKMGNAIELNLPTRAALILELVPPQNR